VAAGAGGFCAGSGGIGAIVTGKTSDQLSYWSDDRLLFSAVNIFLKLGLMLGLPDQLRQRQETPSIKYGEMVVERISGTRVRLVCPFLGHGERSS